MLARDPLWQRCRYWFAAAGPGGAAEGAELYVADDERQVQRAVRMCNARCNMRPAMLVATCGLQCSLQHGACNARYNMRPAMIFTTCGLQCSLQQTDMQPVTVNRQRAARTTCDARRGTSELHDATRKRAIALRLRP